MIVGEKYEVVGVLSDKDLNRIYISENIEFDFSFNQEIFSG